MHLPGPLRAAVGIVASAADEVKTLPDRAIELPMLAVSTALQVSLRAQQRYAQFAARGDEVLNRQRPGDDPPPWATFDAPVTDDAATRSALAQLDSLAEGGSTGRMLEDLFGVADPDQGSDDPDEAGSAADVVPITEATGNSNGRTARKRAAKRPAAKRPATKRAAAKRPAAKKTEAAQAAPPAKKATPRSKTVQAPRNGSPSRFDRAGDDSAADAPSDD